MTPNVHKKVSLLRTKMCRKVWYRTKNGDLVTWHFMPRQLGRPYRGKRRKGGWREKKKVVTKLCCPLANTIHKITVRYTRYTSLPHWDFFHGKQTRSLSLGKVSWGTAVLPSTLIHSKHISFMTVPHSWQGLYKQTQDLAHTLTIFDFAYVLQSNSVANKCRPQWCFYVNCIDACIPFRKQGKYRWQWYVF